MFIEVNELKGLLIRLSPSNLTAYEDWDKINKLLPCVFIAEDEKQKVNFEKHLTPPFQIIEIKKPGFFQLLGMGSLLSNVLEMLSLQPYEVAYLTNVEAELKLIMREPIGTILYKFGTQNISYDSLGFLPDFIIDNFNELIEIITHKIKGYYGETTLTFLNVKDAVDESGFVINSALIVDDKSCELIACGRYYMPTHHRHTMHQLSVRILKSKKFESQNELFSNLLLPVVEMTKADVITRVPPRPSDVRDRLKPLVKYISENYDIEDFTDSLICLSDYPSQKPLGKEARKANVKGKFSADNKVKNKHVILLDDILSTGSTVSECARMLFNKGASRVTVLVIGINQFEHRLALKKQLECPKCNGNLRLVIKKNIKEVFFSCENFLNKTCSYGQNFKDGWKELNEQAKIEKEIEIDYLF